MQNDTAKSTHPTRETKGRFTPGNETKPGNPFARQVAGLRQALVDSVTPADMQAVARALVDAASNGNIQAAKLLLSYAIGKPSAPPKPDHMDADEWEVYRETEPIKQESAEMISAGCPKVHLQMARMLRPLASQNFAGGVADLLMETPEQQQAREDKEAADCEAKLSEPGPDWPPIDEDTLPPTTRNGFHVADNLQPTANSQKGANRQTAANGLQLNGNYS